MPEPHSAPAPPFVPYASGAIMKRWPGAALAAFTTAITTACIGPPPIAPSPIIEPDAALLHAGETRIFRVLNATVRQFSLSGDTRGWMACASIDPEYHTNDSVRIVAENACSTVVYLSADVGPGRTPLVAVVAVR